MCFLGLVFKEMPSIVVINSHSAFVDGMQVEQQPLDQIETARHHCPDNRLRLQCVGSYI